MRALMCQPDSPMGCPSEAGYSTSGTLAVVESVADIGVPSGLSPSLIDLLDRRHRPGLVVDDRVQGAALQDAVSLAAAGGDGVLGRANELDGAAVGPDLQALAHL